MSYILKWSILLWAHRSSGLEKYLLTIGRSSRLFTFLKNTKYRTCRLRFREL